MKNCGYNSARRVGDIVSPGTCSGCRYAESIPPANPYAVITPDSIKSDTSLLDMENYVLQAEQNGGGWVPLVMHHVCTGCNTLSITPALLDAFLAWLAPRVADGTIVKTIGDVIGGPLQAPVSGAYSNLFRCAATSGLAEHPYFSVRTVPDPLSLGGDCDVCHTFRGSGLGVVRLHNVAKSCTARGLNVEGVPGGVDS